jgi:hypothetical protein
VWFADGREPLIAVVLSTHLAWSLNKHRNAIVCQPQCFCLGCPSLIAAQMAPVILQEAYFEKFAGRNFFAVNG